MADDKLNITVKLRDASRAGARSVENNLNKINKSAKEADTSISSIGHSFGRLAIDALRVLAVIQIMRSAFASLAQSMKVFADFDDNIRRAGAVSNATAEELKQLTDIAKEMGATTRFTASQAAEALTFLGMAGLEAKESIAALPGVLNLASAGSLDLATAADIATNVLAAYGLEIEKLSRVNDVLAKTATSSNTNIQELGEAFKDIGAIAAGVGGDFEDVFAALGQLANGAFKGTRAGTALKGAIQALLAPTKQEAKLMEQLTDRLGGIPLKVKNANGAFIGFAEVIEQLEKAGIRGEEALELFGLRAGPGMQTLINQGSVALRKLREEIRDAGGTADRIANEMEAGIGGAIREVVSALESMRIAFSAALGKDTIDLLKFITVRFRAISSALKESENDFNVWGFVVVEILKEVTHLLDIVVTSFRQTGRLVAVSLLALDPTLTFRERIEGIKEGLKDISELGLNLGRRLGFVDIPVEMRIDEALKSFFDEIDNATEPIGRAGSKIGNEIKKGINESLSDVGALRASLIKIRSILDREAEEIENDYKTGLIDLDTYYNERAEIITRRSKAELDLLKAQLAKEQSEKEKDLDKITIINATIFAKEQELQRKLIELTNEKVDEQKKIEEKRLKDLENLKKQEERINRIIEDKKIDNMLSTSEKLEDIHNNELLLLDKKHQEELRRLRLQKANEAQIDELSKQQQIERERLLLEQKKEIDQAKLNSAQEVFSGIAKLSNDLFQLTGSNNKELFALAKAAAIAEATMNTYNAATKALAEGGPIAGPIMATIITAQGLVNVARISAQGLAEGGIVRGYSPTPTADNIPANLTAGEYVNKVSAVKDFGTNFFDLVNRGASNNAIITELSKRGSFSNITVPKIASGRRLAFADGGSVPLTKTQKASVNEEKQPINIFNVTDTREIGNYLTTESGMNAIVNAINTKQKVVKRILY